jgi:gamma-glutamylcyclotransferase (GGCT)/AIG2-like uncharacterized protein YtfP
MSENLLSYLFVYGTLLKDVDNEMSSFLHSHAVLKGKGYFYGKLYRVSWYPGAVISDNTSEKVFGMVYKIENPKYVFRVLDDYEGIGALYPKPHLYKRKLIDTFLNNGTKIKTWVYLYNQSITDLHQIVSGDFLKN